MTITDQALVAAANLADRYISDRFLPDKAIDLIDEAGSRLRIRRIRPRRSTRSSRRRPTESRGKEAAVARRIRTGEEPRRAGEGAPRAEEGDRGAVANRARGVFDVVDEDGRRSPRQVDGHPGLQADRGGDSQAPPDGGRAPQACRRAGGRHHGAVPCDPPDQGRSEGSQEAQRIVHLPGPDRRRQDRARKGACRVPVRRRGRRSSSST